MARDPIDIQALLIRRDAAHQLLGKEDPIELLTMIVLPSEEVEAASLAVARERGPTQEAIKLSRMREERPEHPVRDAARAKTLRLSPPVAKRRNHSRFATLDELLAR